MKIKNIPNDPVAFTMVLLRIFKHLDDREMSLTDQRVLVAATLGQRTSPENGLTVPQLAKLTGLSKGEVERIIPPLLASRYLHEIVPLFGQIGYKLGPVGQTFANSVRREFEKADEEVGEPVGK